jgi:predicted transcriptional regulator
MVRIMSIKKNLPINYDLNSIPVLNEKASLKKCLDLMTKLGKGISIFVDDNNIVKGVLTDGDLRRLLLNHQNPLPSLLIADAVNFGNKNPILFQENTEYNQVSEIFKQKHISQILFVDSNNKLLGYLNGYDLINSD